MSWLSALRFKYSATKDEGTEYVNLTIEVKSSGKSIEGLFKLLNRADRDIQEVIDVYKLEHDHNDLLNKAYIKYLGAKQPKSKDGSSGKKPIKRKSKGMYKILRRIRKEFYWEHDVKRTFLGNYDVTVDTVRVTSDDLMLNLDVILKEDITEIVTCGVFGATQELRQKFLENMMFIILDGVCKLPNYMPSQRDIIIESLRRMGKLDEFGNIEEGFSFVSKKEVFLNLQDKELKLGNDKLERWEQIELRKLKVLSQQQLETLHDACIKERALFLSNYRGTIRRLKEGKPITSEFDVEAHRKLSVLRMMKDWAGVEAALDAIEVSLSFKLDYDEKVKELVDVLFENINRDRYGSIKDMYAMIDPASVLRNWNLKEIFDVVCRYATLNTRLKLKRQTYIKMMSIVDILRRYGLYPMKEFIEYADSSKETQEIWALLIRKMSDLYVIVDDIRKVKFQIRQVHTTLDDVDVRLRALTEDIINYGSTRTGEMTKPSYKAKCLMAFNDLVSQSKFAAKENPDIEKSVEFNQVERNVFDLIMTGDGALGCSKDTLIFKIREVNDRTTTRQERMKEMSELRRKLKSDSNTSWDIKMMKLISRFEELNLFFVTELVSLLKNRVAEGEPSYQVSAILARIKGKIGQELCYKITESEEDYYIGLRECLGMEEQMNLMIDAHIDPKSTKRVKETLRSLSRFFLCLPDLVYVRKRNKISGICITKRDENDLLDADNFEEDDYEYEFVFCETSSVTQKDNRKINKMIKDAGKYVGNTGPVLEKVSNIIRKEAERIKDLTYERNTKKRDKAREEFEKNEGINRDWRRIGKEESEGSDVSDHDEGENEEEDTTSSSSESEEDDDNVTFDEMLDEVVRIEVDLDVKNGFLLLEHIPSNLSPEKKPRQVANELAALELLHEMFSCVQNDMAGAYLTKDVHIDELRHLANKPDNVTMTTDFTDQEAIQIVEECKQDLLTTANDEVDELMKPSEESLFKSIESDIKNNEDDFKKTMVNEAWLGAYSFDKKSKDLDQINIKESLKEAADMFEVEANKYITNEGDRVIWKFPQIIMTDEGDEFVVKIQGKASLDDSDEDEENEGVKVYKKAMEMGGLGKSDVQEENEDENEEFFNFRVYRHYNLPKFEEVMCDEETLIKNIYKTKVIDTQNMFAGYIVHPSNGSAGIRWVYPKQEELNDNEHKRSYIHGLVNKLVNLSSVRDKNHVNLMKLIRGTNEMISDCKSKIHGHESREGKTEKGKLMTSNLKENKKWLKDLLIKKGSNAILRNQANFKENMKVYKKMSEEMTTDCDNIGYEDDYKKMFHQDKDTEEKELISRLYSISVTFWHAMSYTKELQKCRDAANVYKTLSTKDVSNIFANIDEKKRNMSTKMNNKGFCYELNELIKDSYKEISEVSVDKIVDTDLFKKINVIVNKYTNGTLDSSHEMGDFLTLISQGVTFDDAFIESKRSSLKTKPVKELPKIPKRTFDKWRNSYESNRREIKQQRESNPKGYARLTQLLFNVMIDENVMTIADIHYNYDHFKFEELRNVELILEFLLNEVKSFRDMVFAMNIFQTVNQMIPSGLGGPIIVRKLYKLPLVVCMSNPKLKDGGGFNVQLYRMNKFVKFTKTELNPDFINEKVTDEKSFSFQTNPTHCQYFAEAARRILVSAVDIWRDVCAKENEQFVKCSFLEFIESCKAKVNGRSFEDVEEFLENVHYMCMMTMDNNQNTSEICNSAVFAVQAQVASILSPSSLVEKVCSRPLTSAGLAMMGTYLPKLLRDASKRTEEIKRLENVTQNSDDQPVKPFNSPFSTKKYSLRSACSFMNSDRFYNKEFNDRKQANIKTTINLHGVLIKFSKRFEKLMSDAKDHGLNRNVLMGWTDMTKEEIDKSLEKGTKADSICFEASDERIFMGGNQKIGMASDLVSTYYLGMLVRRDVGTRTSFASSMAGHKRLAEKVNEAVSEMSNTRNALSRPKTTPSEIHKFSRFVNELSNLGMKSLGDKQALKSTMKAMKEKHEKEKEKARKTGKFANKAKTNFTNTFRNKLKEAIHNVVPENILSIMRNQQDSIIKQITRRIKISQNSDELTTESGKNTKDDKQIKDETILEKVMFSASSERLGKFTKFSKMNLMEIATGKAEEIMNGKIDRKSRLDMLNLIHMVRKSKICKSSCFKPEGKVHVQGVMNFNSRWQEEIIKMAVDSLLISINILSKYIGKDKANHLAVPVPIVRFMKDGFIDVPIVLFWMLDKITKKEEVVSFKSTINIMKLNEMKEVDNIMNGLKDADYNDNNKRKDAMTRDLIYHSVLETVPFDDSLLIPSHQLYELSTILFNVTECSITYENLADVLRLEATKQLGEAIINYRSDLDPDPNVRSKMTEGELRQAISQCSSFIYYSTITLSKKKLMQSNLEKCHRTLRELSMEWKSVSKMKAMVLSKERDNLKNSTIKYGHDKMLLPGRSMCQIAAKMQRGGTRDLSVGDISNIARMRPVEITSKAILENVKNDMLSTPERKTEVILDCFKDHSDRKESSKERNYKNQIVTTYSDNIDHSKWGNIMKPVDFAVCIKALSSTMGDGLNRLCIAGLLRLASRGNQYSNDAVDEFSNPSKMSHLFELNNKNKTEVTETVIDLEATFKLNKDSQLKTRVDKVVEEIDLERHGEKTKRSCYQDNGATITHPFGMGQGMGHATSSVVATGSALLCDELIDDMVELFVTLMNDCDEDFIRWIKNRSKFVKLSLESRKDHRTVWNLIDLMTENKRRKDEGKNSVNFISYSESNVDQLVKISYVQKGKTIRSSDDSFGYRSIQVLSNEFSETILRTVSDLLNVFIIQLNRSVKSWSSQIESEKSVFSTVFSQIYSNWTICGSVVGGFDKEMWGFSQNVSNSNFHTMIREISSCELAMLNAGCSFATVLTYHLCMYSLKPFVILRNMVQEAKLEMKLVRHNEQMEVDDPVEFGGMPKLSVSNIVKGSVSIEESNKSDNMNYSLRGAADWLRCLQNFPPAEVQKFIENTVIKSPSLPRKKKAKLTERTKEFLREERLVEAETKETLRSILKGKDYSLELLSKSSSSLAEVSTLKISKVTTDQDLIADTWIVEKMSDRLRQSIRSKIYYIEGDVVRQIEKYYDDHDSENKPQILRDLIVRSKKSNTINKSMKSPSSIGDEMEKIRVSLTEVVLLCVRLQRDNVPMITTKSMENVNMLKFCPRLYRGSAKNDVVKTIIHERDSIILSWMNDDKTETSLTEFDITQNKRNFWRDVKIQSNSYSDKLLSNATADVLLYWRGEEKLSLARCADATLGSDLAIVSAVIGKTDKKTTKEEADEDYEVISFFEENLRKLKAKGKIETEGTYDETDIVDYSIAKLKRGFRKSEKFLEVHSNVNMSGTFKTMSSLLYMILEIHSSCQNFSVNTIKSKDVLDEQTSMMVAKAIGEDTQIMGERSIVTTLRAWYSRKYVIPEYSMLLQNIMRGAQLSGVMRNFEETKNSFSLKRDNYISTTNDTILITTEDMFVSFGIGDESMLNEPWVLYEKFAKTIAKALFAPTQTIITEINAVDNCSDAISNMKRYNRHPVGLENSMTFKCWLSIPFNKDISPETVKIVDQPVKTEYLNISIYAINAEKFPMIMRNFSSGKESNASNVSYSDGKVRVEPIGLMDDEEAKAIRSELMRLNHEIDALDDTKRKFEEMPGKQKALLLKQAALRKKLDELTGARTIKVKCKISEQIVRHLSKIQDDTYIILADKLRDTQIFKSTGEKPALELNDVERTRKVLKDLELPSDDDAAQRLLKKVISKTNPRKIQEIERDFRIEFLKNESVDFITAVREVKAHSVSSVDLEKYAMIVRLSEVQKDGVFLKSHVPEDDWKLSKRFEKDEDGNYKIERTVGMYKKLIDKEMDEDNQELEMIERNMVYLTIEQRIKMRFDKYNHEFNKISFADPNYADMLDKLDKEFEDILGVYDEEDFSNVILPTTFSMEVVQERQYGMLPENSIVKAPYTYREDVTECECLEDIMEVDETLVVKDSDGRITIHGTSREMKLYEFVEKMCNSNGLAKSSKVNDISFVNNKIGSSNTFERALESLRLRFEKDFENIKYHTVISNLSSGHPSIIINYLFRSGSTFMSVRRSLQDIRSHISTKQKEINLKLNSIMEEHKILIERQKEMKAAQNKPRLPLEEKAKVSDSSLRLIAKKINDLEVNIESLKQIAATYKKAIKLNPNAIESVAKLAMTKDPDLNKWMVDLVEHSEKEVMCEIILSNGYNQYYSNHAKKLTLSFTNGSADPTEIVNLFENALQRMTKMKFVFDRYDLVMKIIGGCYNVKIT